MNTKRWIVTYTKHIKQKRKIYQDGILELCGSGEKVALYDDCEKLIGSRFLKNEEKVECGGMLAFENHLVDIGDPEESHIPPAGLHAGGKEVKLDQRVEAHGQKKSAWQSIQAKSHSNAKPSSIKENNKSTLQSRSAQYQLDYLRSNSRDSVRKQSEDCSFGAPQGHLDATQATFKEWGALYTTQITQKAKRYHDGILRLASCGSHMNQVILLNEEGAVLSSKYLKSVEHVETGHTFEFPNYLVEIGDPRPLPGDDIQKYPSEQNACSRSSRIGKPVSLGKDSSNNLLPNDLQNEDLEPGTDCNGSAGFTDLNSKILCDEWNALYTTQITKKAKIYHDGILRLADCGSHMKQVILLSEDGAVLSSKYLKSVKCLETGHMLELPNYLVEICEPRTPKGDGTHKASLEQVAVAGSRSASTCKFRSSSKPSSKDLHTCYQEQVTGGSSSDDGRFTSLTNKPKRDAWQILSTLKRPSREEGHALRKLQVEHAHESKSSDLTVHNVESESNMEPDTLVTKRSRQALEDHQKGNTVAVGSDYQGKFSSHEYSMSSNHLSREVASDTSPTKLDVEHACLKKECLANSAAGEDSDVEVLYSSPTVIYTDSLKGVTSGDGLSIGPFDSTSAIAAEENTLQCSSANMPDPVDSMDTSLRKRSSADEFRNEIKMLQQGWTSLADRVSSMGNMQNLISSLQNDTQADVKCETPVCMATDLGSKNPEFQNLQKICVNEDECPTFDLGF